jgi:hypothetical protein
MSNTPNSGSTSSTYGQNPGSSSSGSTIGSAGTSGSTSGTTAGSSGSTYGQTSTGSTVSAGSTYGQTGTGSTSGSSGSAMPGSATSGAVAGSSDNASLRTVTGAVAKIDQNSITLDQAAGGVTLTVDSQTQVLRRGQPVAAGISAIHEGQQIRASFDPASNRADKIEVMGKGTAKHKHTMPGAPNSNTPQPSTDTANPPK